MFLSLLKIREGNVKFNVLWKEFRAQNCSTRILPLYCKIDHCDLYVDIQWSNRFHFQKKFKNARNRAPLKDKTVIVNIFHVKPTIKVHSCIIWEISKSNSIKKKQKIIIDRSDCSVVFTRFYFMIWYFTYGFLVIYYKHSWR